MYQPPPVPGWQMTQLPALPQAQVELQQELCRRFHFTLEDLLWNRQGRFSPAQQSIIERADTRFRRLWLFWFVRLGLFLLLLEWLFISSQNHPNINDSLNSANFPVPALLVALGLFYIAYPVLGLSLLYIPLRGYFATSAQLQAGVVSTVEGALESYEKTCGDSPSDYYYGINNLHFKINGKQLAALKNIRCRLHFAPAQKRRQSPGIIVSIELLEPPSEPLMVSRKRQRP